jgi:hypothetical protein
MIASLPVGHGGQECLEAAHEGHAMLAMNAVH